MGPEQLIKQNSLRDVSTWDLHRILLRPHVNQPPTSRKRDFRKLSNMCFEGVPLASVCGEPAILIKLASPLKKAPPKCMHLLALKRHTKRVNLHAFQHSENPKILPPQAFQGALLSSAIAGGVLRKPEYHHRYGITV